jgi:hypothetical protein
MKPTPVTVSLDWRPAFRDSLPEDRREEALEILAGYVFDGALHAGGQLLLITKVHLEGAADDRFLRIEAEILVGVTCS